MNNRDTPTDSGEIDTTKRHHFRPPRAAVFNRRQHYPRFRAWNRGATLAGSAIGSSKTIQTALNSGVDGLLFNQGAWGSDHPGGTFFCRADGSTTFVSDTIQFATLLALASREGREVLPADGQ